MMISSFKSRMFSLSIAVAAVMAISSLWGCAASKKYGHLEYDDEVKSIFLSLEILPDHKYYWVGSQNSPRVIIAIDEKYTLKSDIWKPIDLTAEQLRIWIDRSGTRAMKDMSRSGKYILDAEGNRLGMWFANRSDKDYSRIKRLEGNEISISAPIEENKRRQCVDCGDR